MTRILTVGAWIGLTNGDHLKDDAREIATLGDGGWLSIQASRYHNCDPQLDRAKSYRTIEIGGKGVLEGPREAAQLLRDYWLERGHAKLFARVPIEVAETYVLARGGIIAA